MYIMLCGVYSHVWKKIVIIILNGETILSGVRIDKNWYILDVPVILAQSLDLLFSNATIPKVTHYANLLAHTNTLTDRVNVYMVSLVNPALSTLCTILDNGSLVSFSGHVTSKQVVRFSESMYQGHLTQESQGI